MLRTKKQEVLYYEIGGKKTQYIPAGRCEGFGGGAVIMPMYRLPADDAHLREWLRPISALMVTRRTSYFSNDDAGSDAGGHSAMIQRINRKRRKRAAKINMPKFWHLHDQGLGVAEMADRLDVSTRSVERAMTMRRIDG